MRRIDGVITKSLQGLLANYRYAVLCAVILSFIPYVTCLSGALIALITLRRGPRDGAMVLVPVLLMHFAGSLVSLSYGMAAGNTLLTFVPGYLAAATLYFSVSWRVLGGVLLVLVLVLMLMLHLVAPELVQTQLMYLKHVAQDAEHGGMILSLMKDWNEAHQIIFANYLLGIQAMTVVVYNLLGVFLARSVQASLFNPGGFAQEVLLWRLRRSDLALSLLIVLAAVMGYALAVNLVPLLLVLVMCAGFACSARFLKQKAIKYYWFMLLVPLLALPVVVFPVYVLIGFVDGLVQFRFIRGL